MLPIHPTKNNSLRAAAVTALFLTLLPSILCAQAAQGDKTAPNAAQAAAEAAEMAKPLTPADKKFIKEAMENLYFELAVTEVAIRRNRPVGAGRDNTRQLADRLHPELQKAWEEVSKFARAKNEKVREELSGVEKRDVEEIRSVAIEKFHKEVTAQLGKVGKEVAQTFASTAIQHPVLKKIAARHAPTFNQHVLEIAQAAK